MTTEQHLRAEQLYDDEAAIGNLRPACDVDGAGKTERYVLSLLNQNSHP